MFVFDTGRRQTFPFDIWKTRTPLEEHVKYYFSGDKQKHSIYGSVTTMHVLTKVAFCVVSSPPFFQLVEQEKEVAITEYRQPE
jgi:hypothetical protein